MREGGYADGKYKFIIPSYILTDLWDTKDDYLREEDDSTSSGWMGTSPSFFNM